MHLTKCLRCKDSMKFIIVIFLVVIFNVTVFSSFLSSLITGPGQRSEIGARWAVWEPDCGPDDATNLVRRYSAAQGPEGKWRSCWNLQRIHCPIPFLPDICARVLRHLMLKHSTTTFLVLALWLRASNLLTWLTWMCPLFSLISCNNLSQQEKQSFIPPLSNSSQRASFQIKQVLTPKLSSFL